MIDVDGRKGPGDMGKIFVTTFAGRVVGDNIKELIDIELCGNLSAGNLTFS